METSKAFVCQWLQLDSIPRSYQVVFSRLLVAGSSSFCTGGMWTRGNRCTSCMSSLSWRDSQYTLHRRCEDSWDSLGWWNCPGRFYSTGILHEFAGQVTRFYWFRPMLAFSWLLLWLDVKGYALTLFHPVKARKRIVSVLGVQPLWGLKNVSYRLYLLIACKYNIHEVMCSLKCHV